MSWPAGTRQGLYKQIVVTRDIRELFRDKQGPGMAKDRPGIARDRTGIGRDSGIIGLKKLN